MGCDESTRQGAEAQGQPQQPLTTPDPHDRRRSSWSLGGGAWQRGAVGCGQLRSQSEETAKPGSQENNILVTLFSFLLIDLLPGLPIG